MLTLYTHTWACATALQILLEHLELPYEAIEVTFWDPEYKKINPKWAVPALKDSDLWDIVLTQLPAIAKYILRKKYGNDLGSSFQEYELDSMLSLLGSDIHTSFGPIFWSPVFTTETDENAITAVKQAGINRAFKNLQYLDTLLWEKTYLVGNTLSVADFYAYVITTWAQMFFPEDFNTLKNLVRLNQTIGTLTEVKKIYWVK